MPCAPPRNSACEETTRAAIADRATDPDAQIRSAALRWLRAHPEQPKTELATNYTNQHGSEPLLPQ